MSRESEAERYFRFQNRNRAQIQGAALGCALAPLVFIVGAFVLMIFAGIIMLIIGRDDHARRAPPPKQKAPRTVAKARPKPSSKVSKQAPLAQIPGDLTYAVVDDNDNGRLRVRLNRRVSAEILRAVAERLKVQNPRSHNPAGLRDALFYLPGMDEQSRAWARASYDPQADTQDWKIEIFGLAVDEERKLLAADSPAPEQNVIGQWLDDTPFSEQSRLTIFRKDGKLLVEQRFKDGSRDEAELVERDSPDGDKFEYVMPPPGFEQGTYLLINKEGNLEEWVPASAEVKRDLASSARFKGDFGLYMTAHPVE